jgi:hypothetical protein
VRRPGGLGTASEVRHALAYGRPVCVFCPDDYPSVPGLTPNDVTFCRWAGLAALRFLPPPLFGPPCLKPTALRCAARSLKEVTAFISASLQMDPPVPATSVVLPPRSLASSLAAPPPSSPPPRRVTSAAAQTAPSGTTSPRPHGLHGPQHDDGEATVCVVQPGRRSASGTASSGASPRLEIGQPTSDYSYESLEAAIRAAVVVMEQPSPAEQELLLALTTPL